MPSSLVRIVIATADDADEGIRLARLNDADAIAWIPGIGLPFAIAETRRAQITPLVWSESPCSLADGGAAEVERLDPASQRTVIVKVRGSEPVAVPLLLATDAIDAEDAAIDCTTIAL
jgi:hypothetical protein